MMTIRPILRALRLVGRQIDLIFCGTYKGYSLADRDADRKMISFRRTVVDTRV